MNLQASEEVLSVAEVTETNQVTVGTVTTSTTDTQAVGGVSAYYTPLCYLGKRHSGLKI